MITRFKLRYALKDASKKKRDKYDTKGLNVLQVAMHEWLFKLNPAELRGQIRKGASPKFHLWTGKPSDFFFFFF